MKHSFSMSALTLTALLSASSAPCTMGQDVVYPVCPDQEISQFNPTSTEKGVSLASDILAVALPVATLTGVLIEQDWQGLKQGALAGATAAAATLILKYTISEERPNHRNMHSFPSGHTVVGFTTAAFIQRRYGWALGGPAYGVAACLGVGRIWSRQHHWWDVVAGAAIGTGCAYIYTRPWARRHQLSVAPVVDPVSSTYGLTASFRF